MKQNIARIIILFFVCYISSSILYAQEKGILIHSRDTMDVDIVSAMNAYQSPIYSDPELPAFTFVSKNRNAALGIGGYVRFTTSYDFGGSIDNRDFVIYQIPMITSRSQSNRFRMDATTSRLYVRFLKRTRWGLFHLYVDNDFGGPGNNIRFNLIYASIGHLKLGRYWSVMADIETYPPSVDFQGPNSFAGMITYQLSYTGALSKHLSYGVGLEIPSYSINDSLSASKVSQRIPSLPLYIQTQGKWGHLRLSGLIRPLLYKNTSTQRDRYAFTWGGILSSIIKPTSSTSFYMQAIYGLGIGNYIFDFNDNGLDLIPSVSEKGKLEPFGLWGGFAGASHRFNSDMMLSATYSYLRGLDRGNYYPTLYKQGQYVTATFYYDITQKMQFALEYDFGHLKHYNRQDGRANRVIGMLRYDF